LVALTCLSGRRIVILCFCVALLLPLAVQRVLPGRWLGVKLENRQPKPLPEWPANWREWNTFPARFEAWHGDTFGARDEWLRWHHAQTMLVFGAAPTPTLLMGRQGWIFFTGDNSRNAWLGRVRLSDEQIGEWSSRLEARVSYFRERGIDYRFVIAPNKESIYPEMLPEGEWRSGPVPLDQWLSGLSPAARACVLDVRPALLDEKRFDDAATGILCISRTEPTGRSAPHGAWPANSIRHCPVARRCAARWMNRIRATAGPSTSICSSMCASPCGIGSGWSRMPVAPPPSTGTST
jgi:hypothetical protein